MTNQRRTGAQTMRKQADTRKREQAWAHIQERRILCEGCDGSLTETDYLVGTCTQCERKIS